MPLDPSAAGQAVAQVGLVHDQSRLRVVEEDAQLVGGVAVVDVERRGPELERGEQQLEVGATVAEEQTDAGHRVPRRSGSAARRPSWPAGRARRSSSRSVAVDHRLPVRDRVDHHLEQLAQVPLQHLGHDGSYPCAAATKADTREDGLPTLRP